MEPHGSRLARLLFHGAAVTVLYAATAVWLLDPLFADPWRSHLGASGPGAGWVLPDFNLVMWVMAWDWHALTTDAVSLFDANIFHPAPKMLAASEHMLGNLPVFGPVYGMTGNPVFANQVHLLLCFALSGASVYALVRHWGAGALPAWLAGFVYAFGPLRLHFLPNSQMMATYYLPIALLSFDRALRGARGGWVALFGAAMLMQFLCSYYLAYMSAFALLAYGTAALIVRRGRVESRSMIQLAIATLVVGAVFAMVSLPYIELEQEGLIPDYGGRGRLRINATGLLQAYLQRPTDVALAPFTAPSLYLGYSVLICCIGAFGWSRMRQSRVPWAATGALAIAVISYLMGLGPELRIRQVSIPMPYSWALEIVPGFAAMRIPRRFALFVLLGVACLVGLSLERIFRTARLGVLGRIAASLLLIGLFVWDLDLMGREYETRRPQIEEDLPPIYSIIAELPDGPLLEIPVGGRADGFENALRESERMLYSTYHWKRLLNGYSGYAPPSYALMVAIAQQLPSQRAIDLLARSTGVRYVLVHAATLTRQDVHRWRTSRGVRTVAREGTDWLFEIEGVYEQDLRERFLQVREATETLLGTPLDPLPARDQRADVVVRRSSVARVRPRGRVLLVTEITNQGTRAWPSLAADRARTVQAGCRWYRRNGRVAGVDKPTTRLSTDLRPGQKTLATVKCRAPAGSGLFELKVSLAQGDRWFASASEPISIRVENPPR